MFPDPSGVRFRTATVRGANPISSDTRQPLEFAFLGTGNAFANGRYWNSFLLNRRYLFEVPPTVLPHLKKMDLSLEEIEVAFVSHFHGDHFFGLTFLLLEYVHVTPRTKDLTIVGPPGIRERVEVVTEAGFPHLSSKEPGYNLIYQEVKDGREERLSTSDGLLTFQARRVEHVPDFECYGFRVQVGGRTVAYSGDAILCDPLVALGEGADVFVLECSSWDADAGAGLHLRPSDIAELRKRISPRTAFILTHLDAGRRDLGLENVLVAEDFAIFSL
jgi:ribonuclease BN (tRNA processing enzyme)